MNVTSEVAKIINNTIGLAVDRKYEYVTPELMLLFMCETENFRKAFSECGGSIPILQENLEGYLADNVEVIEDNSQPDLSNDMTIILGIAQNSAMNSGRNIVDISHIVHGLFSLRESYAVYFISQQDIDEIDILHAISDIEASSITIIDDDEEFQDEETTQNSYAPCLNYTLKDINPLIGREAELDRTIQILCRKDKNNPLHIGDPGVGKTAITYGLVQRINEGKVPDVLKGAKIFALDLGSILAGTQYRGDFEKRLKRVLEDVLAQEKPIIYIDEIHNLLGAGAIGEGSFDAANILKPYMADGHIRFIGATTYEEYKKHFEKSKSLVRRFQNVEISEPSEEETIEILKGLKKEYEKFHGVFYKKGVLEYAVSQSKKYINERFLPDKAIDLIDEAGAYRKIHPIDDKKQYVDKELIDEILTSICKIPKQTVETDAINSLKSLEIRMLSKIFGQDSAVSQVVNAVKFSKAGLLEDNKPLASLLFVGPTGVGKTEIAKNLAKELGIKLIRFDMSEYGEKHAVAKLIGAPAGYVGYEEGGLLTEAVRKSPSAVLLLDEIEKAHPDIFSTLLQVMDYATLTDNQGRKADFRNVIIIMTSNAGASRLGKAGIGFQASDISNETLLEEIKHVFTPEFRNRLSKIVIFNAINDDMSLKIARKKLDELADLLRIKNIEFSYNEEAVALLKSKGTNIEYGAREVDRVIQNEIKPLMVNEILFGKLKKGGKCKLEAKNKDFVLLFGK